MKHHRILQSFSFAIGQFCMLALLSCGEYWDSSEPPADVDFSLGRASIDLMVGDSYSIPVVFVPDDVKNKGVWWSSDDDEIARMDDGTVVAVAEGVTTIQAMSVVNHQEASCTVKVWPRWQVSSGSHPYDMVVYADITIHGEPVPEGVLVGAFIGNELRGVAETVELKGRTCTVIRIWGDAPSSEVVFFRHYDPHTATMGQHEFWLPFTDDGFGSPSRPYAIELD